MKTYAHNASTIQFSPLPLAFLCIALPTLGLCQGRPDIVWTTNAHTARVNSVAISPDSTLVASGGDQKLKVWRVSDGGLIHIVTNFTAEVLAVAFSPSGDSLGASTDWGGPAPNLELTTLLRISDGRELWSVTNRAEALAFSPDGALLATTGRSYYGDIQLLAVSDGTVLRRLPFASTG